VNDSLNGCQSRGKALPAGQEVLLPLPKIDKFRLADFFIQAAGLVYHQPYVELLSQFRLFFICIFFAQKPPTGLLVVFYNSITLW
jgi:hypothetical protein